MTENLEKATENVQDQGPNQKQSMLKTCETCGKEYAKSAKACPYCGAVNKKPSRNDVKLEKFKSMTPEQLVKREKKNHLHLFHHLCCTPHPHHCRVFIKFEQQ